MQLGLGVATWVVNHGWPVWVADYNWAAGYVVDAYSHTQIWSTTAHVATGALIFAITWLVSLRILRLQAALGHGMAGLSPEADAPTSTPRSMLALAAEGAL